MSDLVLNEVREYLFTNSEDYEIISFDAEGKCSLVKIVKGRFNAYRECLMCAMSRHLYFGWNGRKKFESWKLYFYVVRADCSDSQLWRVQYPCEEDVRKQLVDLMSERELVRNIKSMVSYSRIFRTHQFIVRPRNPVKYDRSLLRKVVKNYC
nr:hypothetical protein [Sicyoidochytrium minutum DNA virus]